MSPAVSPRRDALVAIDLGAESCRVSLLRVSGERPSITMVCRFPNGPEWDGRGFRWNLRRICAELETGLRACADLAPEGIASIGVTGWAVDYVRLDAAGQPLGDPFCYRDARNSVAMREVSTRIAGDELYARTGVQVQPLNTLYQLWADRACGIPESAPWINLPEYILCWLGAPRIAEYTNATHTGLINPETRQWDDELFHILGFDLDSAPRLVPPGTILGPLRSSLRHLPAFATTQLIAPACHDTASAVAGIRQPTDDWAYLSSGTWSLLGVVLPQALRTDEARQGGFTNLGAVGGGVLFHAGAPGMWLLRQCMNAWDQERDWNLPGLIAAARQLPTPERRLDLADPEFLPPGDMPARIDAQLQRRGLEPLPSGCDAAPQYANLIFHSLAAHYASLLQEIGRLTSRCPRTLCAVGGGSRNDYLNDLTSRHAGISVLRGPIESAMLGNFAVQQARLQQQHDGVSSHGLSDALEHLCDAQWLDSKLQEIDPVW